MKLVSTTSYLRIQAIQQVHTTVLLTCFCLIATYVCMMRHTCVCANQLKSYHHYIYNYVLQRKYVHSCVHEG